MSVNTKIHSLISDRQFCCPITFDSEVVQVACVWSHLVLHSMLFVVWIEMCAGRFELRAFTLSHLVNVDRVFTRRKTRQIQHNPHTLSRRRDLCRADALP